MSGLACPDCPVCGHPPAFVVGATQAFCDNDDCTALMWNPSKSRADNMRDAGTIDLSGDGGDS